jgi:hypothetical protein
MAYFVVVPAFVLWLLIAAAAIIAIRAVPRLTSAYSYVLRISIWATIGVVAANALLICLLTLGFGALERTEPLPSTAHDILRVAWGLAAIGGPIIASGLGWIAGCTIGADLAFLRGRRVAA